MTSAQAQAILDYCPIDGASIADWFKRWKSNDLNRIAQAVQRGAIEELSVDEVAANVWNACNVSRNSARTVVRTIINGVSNAARAETLFANDDVIDGIEFLATLDARTSHICGALDGTVWRGDEMKHARRPPLHPNCRSTLIPVVDLIDPETGEKIEETAERPAQNADGSYSQVAAKTTFKDYFESQPETFQREWLGEKRFELWKSGRLKFEDLAKPATSYRATTADLTPPTEKPKETAASDDNTNNGFALHPIDYKTLPPIDFFGLRKASDKSAALAARRDAVDELNADDAEKQALDIVSPFFDLCLASTDEGYAANLGDAVDAVGGKDAAARLLAQDCLLEAVENLDAWKGPEWLKFGASTKTTFLRAAARNVRNEGHVLNVLRFDAQKKLARPTLCVPPVAELSKTLDEIDIVHAGKVAQLLEKYNGDDSADGYVIEKTALDIKRRDDYLNACFPYDYKRSPLRAALRLKTPSALSGNGKTLDVFDVGNIKDALDFIGRVADNLGVDASAFNDVAFHDELANRAFFAPCDYRKENPLEANILAQYGLKKNVAKRSVVLQDGNGETVAHEFGHVLDDVVSGLGNSVYSYFERITTLEDGKTRTAIDNIYDPIKYPDYAGELYRPVAPHIAAEQNGLRYKVDKSNYALKEYYGDSTELTSMFFQRLYEDIVTYRNGDNKERRRHFHAMFELLRDNATKRGIPYATLHR